MIIEKEKCTGCFACVNKCPKKCIKMEEDENGHIYPQIDKEKCIHCNLCKKVCPSVNKVELLYPKKCYSMYSKDTKIRKTSTSGGVATICSKYVISRGGIVYGAAFQKDEITIKHIRVEKENELEKLQGSKYVHSYIDNNYTLAKQDLEKGKEVLFIGTPCQIAGLKNYLQKDYEKLYTIDIICHGVPSQKYLKDEIKSLTEEKVDDIKFRTQEGFKLNLYKDGNLISKKDKEESIYYYGFFYGLTYRENCYNCLYARPERCSDITIGDFWGIDKNAKIYDDDKKGISVVLPITEKGLKLIEQCKVYFQFEEREIEEAIKGNAQLHETSKKPNNYKKLQKKYIKNGYIKMGKTMFKRVNLKNKLKRNKVFYKIYKKLKKKD